MMDEDRTTSLFFPQYRFRLMRCFLIEIDEHRSGMSSRGGENESHLSLKIFTFKRGEFPCVDKRSEWKIGRENFEYSSSSKKYFSPFFR